MNRRGMEIPRYKGAKIMNPIVILAGLTVTAVMAYRAGYEAGTLARWTGRPRRRGRLLRDELADIRPVRRARLWWGMLS